MFENIDDTGDRFLLEDVGGRTAIVGAGARFVLKAKDGMVFLSDRQGERRLFGDPFDILKEQLSIYSEDYKDAPDIPFAGGAVGYFSYDLGRSIESIPNTTLDDISTPDFCLGFYDSALCIDLQKHNCVAVSASGDQDAVNYWKSLACSMPDADDQAQGRVIHCPGSPDEIRSNFTREEYLDAINKIKDYIAAGDIYQVNLTQRFESELRSSPWNLYKALRRINPAPHSCYLELGPLTVASASPEVFLTYDPVTRLATTKPIKGTRPRGRDQEEDAKLAIELAASEKDRAENLMIVDMERNDLGRVARYGSVDVPSLWDIEAHPNVFQMVSTVTAQLAQNYGPVDLLKSCFPGGSITGAPKIRAMEIIEELEPNSRGIYTGSAGYIDYRGKMDLNIMIRSFIINDFKAYFHAGGGIVIDSEPESEYQETLDKIAGLRMALRESE